MTASNSSPAKSSASVKSSSYQPQDPLKWLDQVESSLSELRSAIELSEQQRVNEERQAFDRSMAESRDSAAFGDQQPLRIVLLDHANPAAESMALPRVGADEDASDEVWQVAVARRDQYISYLCESVREIAIRIEAWLRLLQERSLDTETVVVVHDAESCVKQIVKAMTIEHAIQRAELAREQARLEADRKALEHEREAMLDSLNVTDRSEETPLMQRWRRFLTSPKPRAKL